MTAAEQTISDTADRFGQKVLVLGASGFIGSHVMTALTNNRRYHAVAASRRSTLRVDATDSRSVQEALRDVEYVINCIAGNDRTMVRSTEVLCEAARHSPPKRIVYLSSMAVYGSATGRVYETQLPVSPISSYGAAKIECERIIQKYVRDGGDAVVLRPTCVFGVGSRQWTMRLERLLVAQRIGDLGSAGDGCCNLAFINDVVAAVIAALEAPAASGRSFNVSSSTGTTWNEFLIAFAAALGATPVRRIPSYQLAVETKLLAPILRIAGKVVKSSRTEAITPSLVALWQQNIDIDCSAAEDVLSLPKTTPERMIATVTRFRQDLAEPTFS